MIKKILFFNNDLTAISSLKKKRKKNVYRKKPRAYNPKCLKSKAVRDLAAEYNSSEMQLF